MYRTRAAPSTNLACFSLVLEKEVLQKHSVLDRDCPLLHYQSSLLKKYCEDHFNLEKLKERVCTLVSTIEGPVSVSKSVCFEEVLLLNTSQNELTIH